jgi:hypothetical protein
VAATVVIEEATFESGARLAALVAQSLELVETVRVILRDDGPLVGWLAEHVQGRIETCNRGNFPYEAPLSERISVAASFLASDSSDIAYVFGLGATDFALAARLQNRRVVLHAYQAESQINHLLARDQTKLDCAAFCDVLLTAGHNRRDLSRLLGSMPSRVQDLGLRVDIDWLSRVSAHPPPELRNGPGDPIQWGRRFVVGGGGVTQEDAAFFVALARHSPRVDFAWLGGGPRGSTGNGSDGKISAATPNLYTGADDHNVWALLRALGSYIICGRATNAPTALAASALGIPVVGFKGSGATELLGHYGILCHGDPNPPLACEILDRIAAEAEAPAVHDPAAIKRYMDIGGCVGTVLQVLADARLMEAG